MKQAGRGDYVKFGGGVWQITSVTDDSWGPQGKQIAGKRYLLEHRFGPNTERSQHTNIRSAVNWFQVANDMEVLAMAAQGSQ